MLSHPWTRSVTAVAEKPDELCRVPKRPSGGVLFDAVMIDLSDQHLVVVVQLVHTSRSLCKFEDTITEDRRRHSIGFNHHLFVLFFNLVNTILVHFFQSISQPVSCKLSVEYTIQEFGHLCQHWHYFGHDQSAANDDVVRR